MSAEMLSDAALPRAIELYCASGSSDAERNDGLNTVIVQLHRGKVRGLDKLVAGHLRPYLTNEEGYVRARATKLLAVLLQRLPDMKLPQNVMLAVVNFLIDRFKSDYESAGPCLLALKAVLELHESDFDVSLTVPIVEALLSAHHVPAMTQSLRSLIYQTLQIILKRQRYCGVIRDSIEGGKLVGLFADAMEGEKDPRCLLVSLRVAALLLRENTLTQNEGFNGEPTMVIDEGKAELVAGLRFASPETEQLAVERIFDVTCVYFPIVFRPPSNDPFNITAEDLWSALHNVFKSHPLMCPQVLGLLADKLSLSSGDMASAQVDSLQTLRVVLPAYGCRAVEPYFVQLRRLLLRLVLQADESTVQEEAVKSARAVARLLAGEEEVLQSFRAAPEDFSESWNGFVGEIVTESTTQVLKSVDSMTGWASGRLLAAIASSSALALGYVLAKALPVVIKWCVRPDANDSQRAAAFELMHRLVDAIDPDMDFAPEHQPLKPQYVDQMFEVLQTELVRKTFMPMEVDSESARPRATSQVTSGAQLSAITALLEIVVRPPSLLISAEQAAEAVERWTALVLSGDSDPAVKEASIKALVKAGKAVPLCAQAISSVSVPLIAERNLAGKSLGVLAELCAIPSVFDTIMPRMLDPAQQQSEQQKSLDAQTKLLAAVAEIVVVNKTYESGLVKCCVPVEDTGVLLPALLQRAAEGRGVGANGNIIVRTLMQNVSESVQEQLLTHAVSLLLEPTHHATPSAESVATLTAVLGSARPQVLRACADSGAFDLAAALTTMLRLSLDVEHGSATLRACAAQLVAALANKAEDQHAQVLEDTAISLLGGCGNTGDSSLRLANLQTLSWFAKALAMRSHHLAPKLSEAMVGFLKDGDAVFAVAAAEYFGTVIAPCDVVLSKECFAKEGLFFKQRFFGGNFRTIRELLASESSTNRTALLLAAVRLVEFVPKGVLLSEDAMHILPLLTQALAASDSVEIRSSALSTLAKIIENKLEATEPHLMSLIPMLLELSKVKSGLRSRHRALAIDCLFSFSSLPYNKIHSVRAKVTRQLLPALDDPKRGIRSRAVKCRNAWVILQNV